MSTKHEPCKIKMANHPEKTKKDMVTRLHRIEGQIRGIAKMINSDQYCDDVLHQMLSVESAIAGVKKSLLGAHIRGCVADQIRSGSDEVITELLATIGKMLR